MTRYELAGWLCRRMQVRRLTRAGMEIPAESSDPLLDLPQDEKQNWIDFADVVLEYTASGDPIERLADLSRDWVRYTLQAGDGMRQAVVVEMQVEVGKLAEECGLGAAAR